MPDGAGVMEFAQRRIGGGTTRDMILNRDAGDLLDEVEEALARPYESFTFRRKGEELLGRYQPRVLPDRPCDEPVPERGDEVPAAGVTAISSRTVAVWRGCLPSVRLSRASTSRRLPGGGLPSSGLPGGGPIAGSMGHWGEVWIACLVVLLSLTLAWFLYSRKIFIRV